MKYDPNIHHRRSIRLKGYDYSQAGLYFVTICCQNREHLFGKIENDIMILNDAGVMIKKCWVENEKYFSNIKLHEYAIMPNHFHAILEIVVGADSISAQNIADSITAQNIADSITAQNIADSISAQNIADSISAQNIAKRADMESAPTDKSGDLAEIMQSFKRYSTIEYIKMVKQNIVKPFEKRIWQRNYWEHIVGDENEYFRIAEYIINNPMKWNNDKLNGGKGNIVMESKSSYGREIWMI